MASNGISRLLEESVLVFALSTLLTLYFFNDEGELMFTIARWSVAGGPALWLILVVVTQKPLQYLRVGVLPMVAALGIVTGSVAFHAMGI